MKFEQLPVELIVEIGDYLDGCDFYKSFYGLNHRINQILDQQCHRFYVNFINISKSTFDSYCKYILPSISTRTVSLTIYGNNSSTPGQLFLFFSRFPSLSNHFPKLESFKLLHYSKTDVQLFLPELNHLTHLKHLSIGDFERLTPFSINQDELFNENVLFPRNLIHLSFPYKISNEWIEKSNGMVSMIEQMHVHFIHMNSFVLFLQKFPYLKRLTTVLGHDNNDLSIENVFQSILQFDQLQYLNVNITQNVIFDQFGLFLEKVPQLRSLSIESLNPELSFFQGHSWERILPFNLYSFHFDLTMTLPLDRNPDELLQSFKSKYWSSRGWLVNCHLRDRGRYFRLFTIQLPVISTLYWPDDEISLESLPNSILYPHVNHIKLWWNLSKSTRAICPKVRSVELYGAGYSIDEPIDSNIHQILQSPSLEHLIINNDLPITPKKFGSALVKSSTNIHILTCSANWLHLLFEDKQNEWICLLLTIRIRKLIIDHSDQSEFSSKDLISFCRTFINLQEITIHLKTMDDICFLFNTLKQLTMAKISLPNNTTETINYLDLDLWIQQNTILENFIFQKESNTCALILWIDSYRTTDSNRRHNREACMRNAMSNIFQLNDH